MLSLTALLFLTNLVFGVIEFLIGMRVILKLFGASTRAPFVNWIYETSAPLLAPFLGAFPSPKVQGGFVIEFSALFGILVYAFVAYGISELINYLEINTGVSNRQNSQRRGRPKKES